MNVTITFRVTTTPNKTVRLIVRLAVVVRVTVLRVKVRKREE